jgi:uncharacterized protein YeaO (DUF488 family)
VGKADLARRDYYDAWLPELAPSAEAVSWALSAPWTDARWRRFGRWYRREMSQPSARHLIGVLAALSRRTEFSVGCYCPDPTRCHRAVLRDLLAEAGADVGRLG